MQVNSAQDYLTQVKRQVISKIYVADPPFGKNKVPSTYLSLKANNASRHQMTVAAACRGNNTCSGLGETNTSQCCTQSGAVLY
jgi:16S rRNA G966 N2-methylase RsmD